MISKTNILWSQKVIHIVISKKVIRNFLFRKGKMCTEISGTNLYVSKQWNLFCQSKTGALTSVAQWLGVIPQGKKSLVLFLVRARAWVAGLFPGRGAYERQPIDVSLSHWCFSPSLSPSLPLSLKIKSLKKRETDAGFSMFNKINKILGKPWGLESAHRKTPLKAIMQLFWAPFITLSWSLDFFFRRFIFPIQNSRETVFCVEYYRENL